MNDTTLKIPHANYTEYIEFENDLEATRYIEKENIFSNHYLVNKNNEFNTEKLYVELDRDIPIGDLQYYDYYGEFNQDIPDSYIYFHIYRIDKRDLSTQYVRTLDFDPNDYINIGNCAILTRSAYINKYFNEVYKFNYEGYFHLTEPKIKELQNHYIENLENILHNESKKYDIINEDKRIFNQLKEKFCIYQYSPNEDTDKLRAKNTIIYPSSYPICICYNTYEELVDKFDRLSGGLIFTQSCCLPIEFSDTNTYCQNNFKYVFVGKYIKLHIDRHNYTDCYREFLNDKVNSQKDYTDTDVLEIINKLGQNIQEKEKVKARKIIWDYICELRNKIECLEKED